MMMKRILISLFTLVILDPYTDIDYEEPTLYMIEPEHDYHCTCRPHDQVTVTEGYEDPEVKRQREKITNIISDYWRGVSFR